MDLDLIKKVAKQKKINLDNLAEMADIKRGTFFNYLSGKTSISAVALKNLSEILEIPITLFYAEPHNLSLLEAAEPVAAYYTRRNIQEVPLVHKFAHNDFMHTADQEEFLQKLPSYPVLMDAAESGDYLCFEVNGDVMFDGTYESRLAGDIILTRALHKQHWSSDLSAHKQNMMIVLPDELMFRRIVSHDLEKGQILTKGLNAQYEEQLLDIDKVRDLYAEIKLIGRHSG